MINSIYIIHRNVPFSPGCLLGTRITVVWRIVSAFSLRRVRRICIFGGGVGLAGTWGGGGGRGNLAIAAES